MSKVPGHTDNIDQPAAYRGHHRTPAGQRYRVEERARVDGREVRGAHRDYTARDEALAEHASLVTALAGAAGLGHEYGPHGTRRLVVTEVK